MNSIKIKINELYNILSNIESNLNNISIKDKCFKLVEEELDKLILDLNRFEYVYIRKDYE